MLVSHLTSSFSLHLSNSIPVHGKVCSPGSFQPFLVAKFVQCFWTTSATAQTKHRPCFPLRHKIRCLKSICVHQFIIMVFRSLIEAASTLPFLRLFRPTLSRQRAQLPALPSAIWGQSYLFFNVFHSSAFHLTNVVTGCSRRCLLKMLTLNKGNLSE